MDGETVFYILFAAFVAMEIVLWFQLEDIGIAAIALWIFIFVVGIPASLLDFEDPVW